MQIPDLARNDAIGSADCHACNEADGIFRLTAHRMSAGVVHMMGIVWCVMPALSVVAAIVTGRVGELTSAAMEGATSAVTLAVSLAGPLCLWSGVAMVMEKGGILRLLGKILRPFLRRLFPEASRDEAALGYLTGNFTANLLGLGNAATPMGIAAVKRMQTLSGKTTASDEMCRLIVLNTASVQLLPTTVVSVRVSLGASSPFDILPAVWLTSVLSVTAGLLAAQVLRRVV